MYLLKYLEHIPHLDYSKMLFIFKKKLLHNKIRFHNLQYLL